MRATSVVLACLISAAGPVRAQSVFNEASLPTDGEARISFTPRPGVCGDGAAVIIADRKRYKWPNTETYGEFPQRECIGGPANVSLRRVAGRTIEIRTVVGGTGGSGTPSVMDVEISPSAAMNFFMRIAESADGPVAAQAVMPAAIATLSGLVPRLTALATNDGRPEMVRLKAVNWLGQIGEPEAIRTLRQIARREPEQISIRSRSLKALWEARAMDVLMEFVRSGAPIELRLVAAGWLGQTPSIESAHMLRSIAIDSALPSALRATAILAYARMKHDFVEPAFLIESYHRAGSVDEKLAVIRGLAEQRDEKSRSWLIAFAADASQPLNLRSFAQARITERKF